ncbi:hypothetical protein BJV82DRAFT_662163 [Fennellomyces sp. T-0311]|nr:hypothetical protein BJV82DRAFT_662163 [Fennellomyces sp. T-0311]
MADDIVSGGAKIPIQSAFKNSCSKCKKVWQRTRDQDILVNGPVVERAVVIAYGDADLRGTMKSLAPVQVQASRRYLGKRALVVCTDEYRTFKVCYGRDKILLDVNDQNMFRCDHHMSITTINLATEKDDGVLLTESRTIGRQTAPPHYQFVSI